jgi:hypothetical protein
MTAWLCETSQSCSSETWHLRERPMRPPAGSTVNMRSAYGPELASSVPLSSMLPRTP